ncbi:TonB-dependent receptor [Sphingomonas alba]|uniref:TonB-dependent receptor n=1 Tax=Sphingomonas alba TaxID=2908208 RepID=A0ABT0RM03_9SPHN|nr:TonB-dependent receptor [Sphingomonas alba]MCL6683674.1 TonB-dependent receptor [Sphingomonas alba]
MSSFKALLAVSSVTSLAFALCSTPAFAEETAAPVAAAAADAAAAPADTAASQAPAADEQKSEGDIVVTARKRSERLQDVPLSVAAVSGATMQQQGIRKIEDLQTKVPNFKMTETGIGSNIAIRGIFSGVNQGFEQSVGTYIDGIHYGRAQQARAPFLDVQRVEVLRGPQSILFGKNSIAGALNIISAQPTNVLTGYVQGSYQLDSDDWELLGAVSGPITDNVRARIAGRIHDGDGFIKNITLDRSEPQRKDWNLRGIVDWDVTDDFTLNFKAEHGEFDTKGRNIEVYNELPSIAGAPFGGKTYAQILTLLGAMSPSDEFVVDPSVSNNIKDDKRSSNGDTSDNTSGTYVLTANWDTGIGQLTSITGYNKFSYDEDCDCDFTGANILTIDLHEKYKQFSQEIRLASDTSRKLEYIVGGFFQTSDHSYSDNINIDHDSILVEAANLKPGAFGNYIRDTRAARQAHVDTDILSAFGQLTYKFNEHFRVNVGGRVTHEKKEGDRNITIEGIDGSTLTGTQAIMAPIVFGSLFHISSSNLTTIAGMGGIPGGQAAGLQLAYGVHPVDGKVSKTGFVPSVVLQYDVNPDIMFYGSFTKGTKSGGFDFRGNNRGFYSSMADAFEFDEEQATNWEVGAKTSFFNHRGIFNASLYHTKIQDLQVSVFDGVLGYVVGNADATTQGLEADARFAVTPHLTLRAAGALTDFEFKKYPNGQCYPGQVPDGANGQCDYKGKTNQLVPDWQATLAVDWNTAITNSLELRTTADMFASDGYFLSPTLDPNQTQGSYAKFNGRIAIGDPGRRWEVALLGKNLFDKRTVSMGVQTPLAFSTFGAYSQANVVDEGRTVALQGRFNF